MPPRHQASERLGLNAKERAIDEPWGAESVLAAVRQHYEAFPFPPVESIYQEDPERDLRASVNLDLDLLGSRAAPPGGTVWVPGCGTRWAVMVALSLSDMHVLGTDLSERSLMAQRALADGLGLTNLTLERADLLEAQYRDEFDLISAVGVLHHLPDPDRGFAVLRRSLKPSGLIELMVYDSYNRQYSQRMQEVLRVLDPEATLSAQERFALATRVLGGLNKHASAPRDVRRVLRLLDTDVAFRRDLADFISHPVEHIFDVPTLLDSLWRAGLEVSSWKMPHRFDPRTMLDDSQLVAAVDELSAARRAQLGHVLSTALLEVFAQRNDAPDARPVRGESEVRLVRACSQGLVHQLYDDGRVRSQAVLAKAVERKTGLLFDGGERRPLVSRYGVDLDCVKPGPRKLVSLREVGLATKLEDAQVTAVVQASLSLAREPRRLRELVDALGRDRGLASISREERLEICERLCRTPTRVLCTVEP